MGRIAGRCQRRRVVEFPKQISAIVFRVRGIKLHVKPQTLACRCIFIEHHTDTWCVSSSSVGIADKTKPLPRLLLTMRPFFQLSHECLISENRFQQLTQPIQVDEQRASALRFWDKRVLALVHALC